MAITMQDLIDAGLDAQTLEDYVNGTATRSNPPNPNGTVTSRLGRVLKTLAKLEADVSAAGIKWKGPWSGATAYVVNDAVSYNGTSYVAVANHTNSAPPSGNWTTLAAKGDQGIQGPQGSQGTQGIQGPAGSISAIGSNLDFTSTYKCINLANPAADRDGVHRLFVNDRVRMRASDAFWSLSATASPQYLTDLLIPTVRSDSAGAVMEFEWVLYVQTPATNVKLDLAICAMTGGGAAGTLTPDRFFAEHHVPPANGGSPTIQRATTLSPTLGGAGNLTQAANAVGGNIWCEHRIRGHFNYGATNGDWLALRANTTVNGQTVGIASYSWCRWRDIAYTETN